MCYSFLLQHRLYIYIYSRRNLQPVYFVCYCCSRGSHAKAVQFCDKWWRIVTWAQTRHWDSGMGINGWQFGTVELQWRDMHPRLTKESKLILWTCKKSHLITGGVCREHNKWSFYAAFYCCEKGYYFNVLQCTGERQCTYNPKTPSIAFGCVLVGHCMFPLKLYSMCPLRHLTSQNDLVWHHLLRLSQSLCWWRPNWNYFVLTRWNKQDKKGTMSNLISSPVY